MAAEEFLIDKTNVYKNLGHDTIVKISTSFYGRVFSDDDVEFHSIFAGRDMQEAIKNQYEFFIERLGGPSLYSQRKGHPALRMRHAPFKIDERAANRWLLHMKSALDENNIAGEDRRALDQFFNHTAHFLKNAD